jgi:hypothetical protein
MDLEVESLTGAPHGSRSAERLTHRNGYRDRTWVPRDSSVVRWATVAVAGWDGRREGVARP